MSEQLIISSEAQNEANVDAQQPFPSTFEPCRYSPLSDTYDMTAFRKEATPPIHLIHCRSKRSGDSSRHKPAGKAPFAHDFSPTFPSARIGPSTQGPLGEVMPSSPASTFYPSNDGIRPPSLPNRKMSWSELRMAVREFRSRYANLCSMAPSDFAFRHMYEMGERIKTRIYFFNSASSSREQTLMYCDISAQAAHHSSDVSELDSSSGSHQGLCSCPLLPHSFHMLRYLNRISKDELMQMERKRIASWGINQYEIEPDSGRIVFSAYGTLFTVVDRGQQVPPFFPDELKSDVSSGRFNPQICPSNPYLVAFILNCDIWVHHIETGLEQQLTFSHRGSGSLADDPLRSGLPSYVIQEEFHRYLGFWWQPVSEDVGKGCTYRILYEEVDESQVKILNFPRAADNDTASEQIRFPRAGTPNATSTLKIVEFQLDQNDLVTNGATVEMQESLQQLFPWMEYLIRVGWLGDGSCVWAQILDRPQKKLKLVLIPLEYFSVSASVSLLHVVDINRDTGLDMGSLSAVSSEKICDVSRQQTWGTKLESGFSDNLRTLSNVQSFSSLPCSQSYSVHSHSVVEASSTSGVSESFVPSPTQPLCHEVIHHQQTCDMSFTSSLHFPPATSERSTPDFSPKPIVLLMELSDIWINVSDILYIFPIEGEQGLVSFIWASEETGFRHLYWITASIPISQSSYIQLHGEVSPQQPSAVSSKYYNAKLHQKVALTSGEWEVLDKEIYVDEVDNLLYFMAVKDGPLEKHLYVVSLNHPEVIRRLTTPGYSYSVSMDMECCMFVALYSNVETLPACEVFTISNQSCDGSVDSLIISSVGFLMEPKCTGTAYQQPQIFSHEISSGDTLYAMVYSPSDLEVGKLYPTVLSVYGGPEVQLVSNSFKGMRQLRQQLLCSLGYVVVVIDSRGSRYRGLKFEAHIKCRMGTVEICDQVEMLHWLAARTGCIDLNRVAIHGWSYGGYLSLMGLAQRPDVFKVAVAGAPVTSWNLYDTAYTERYMKLPNQNPHGYRSGSVLSYVNCFPNDLNRLLIIHGLIDENVHFSHTSQLISALVKAGKPYQLQVYPNERHSLHHLEASEHYETVLLNFLQSYL